MDGRDKFVAINSGKLNTCDAKVGNGKERDWKKKKVWIDIKLIKTKERKKIYRKKQEKKRESNKFANESISKQRK